MFNYIHIPIIIEYSNEITFKTLLNFIEMRECL